MKGQYNSMRSIALIRTETDVFCYVRQNVRVTKATVSFGDVLVALVTEVSESGAQ
jgi:hypothetical protein